MAQRVRTGYAHRVAAWLVGTDRKMPVRTDDDVQAEVAANYRWNFVMHLMDGLLFWLGHAFLSSSTIGPLFISKITTDPMWVGLMVTVGQASWYLPQLLTAGAIERLDRKKPVVIRAGFFLERMPVWILPVAALVAGTDPAAAYALFVGGYALNGLGAGLIAPAWQDLFAETIPVARRGTLFGLTAFIGSGVGAAGAIASGWILVQYPFPTNFALTFTLAAVAMLVSWAFLAFVREPERCVEKEHIHARRGFMRMTVATLREDRSFRFYLFVRVAIIIGTMGTSFITLKAITDFNVADSTVGLFTAAMLLGQTTGNLLAGMVADRWGHKLPLQMGCAAQGLAFAIAWGSPSPEYLYAAFVAIGIAMGVNVVSGILIVMEFAPPNRRPTYAGIANTTVGIASAVAPLLGGAIAGVSFNLLFAISALCSLVALVCLTWIVHDPRRARLPAVGAATGT